MELVICNSMKISNRQKLEESQRRNIDLTFMYMRLLKDIA